MFFFPFTGYWARRDEGPALWPHWNTIREKKENTLGGEATRSRERIQHGGPWLPSWWGARQKFVYDCFFFPLFILFILAGLANAPVSISSGPAEMRCVKRNETQKHSQLILWKCIRRIARWRIGSITLSTTRSFFSVWKRQRRFYLFLAWFLCSGSAIQEMSLPWSNLPTRNCAAVQSSIRDCRKEYPPGVSNQLQRRIMVKKGERKEMERNGKRIWEWQEII